MPEQEEESIEKYMERLMERVRGDKAMSPKPRPAPDLEPEEPAAAAAAPEAETAEPSEPAPVQPAETIRRPPPAEQTIDLAAMREVANTAARSAIERHYQNSRGDRGTGRLFAAGFVLLVSALLGCWAWQTSSVPAAVGAGIALLAGGLWAMRGFGRLLKSLTLSRPAPPVLPASSDRAEIVASQTSHDSTTGSGV
jgi:hypothetical protein